MSTKFVRFIECNDHEGETWNFWLQLTGNEREIGKLELLLREAQEAAPFDLDYRLTTSIEPEPVVDKLVEYADESGAYMAAHKKVVGVFRCPDSLGEDLNDLYKGGLRDHFTAVAQ